MEGRGIRSKEDGKGSDTKLEEIKENEKQEGTWSALRTSGGRVWKRGG